MSLAAPQDRDLFPLHLRYANGWTVSISPDTPPAFCSVAAWPSIYTEAPRDMGLWFDFGDGARDRRCWSLEDVCEAFQLVHDADASKAAA